MLFYYLNPNEFLVGAPGCLHSDDSPIDSVVATVLAASVMTTARSTDVLTVDQRSGIVTVTDTSTGTVSVSSEESC